MPHTTESWIVVFLTIVVTRAICEQSVLFSVQKIYQTNLKHGTKYLYLKYAQNICTWYKGTVINSVVTSSGKDERACVFF